MQLHHIYVR